MRFSRRWYSVSSACAAAVLLVLAMLALDRTLWFETLLTAGFFCASLYQAALGGWLASIVRSEDESRLSVWVNIGNICAGGAMAAFAGELVRLLPPASAALVLGGAILAPTTVFLWMPAPATDISGAHGSLARFTRDLVDLLRRRDVLVAMLLFVAPAATFSLTNFLAAEGQDFHASTRFVGLIGGAAVLLGGAFGCLGFRLIDRLLPLPFLYLSVGIVGFAVHAAADRRPTLARGLRDRRRRREYLSGPCVHGFHRDRFPGNRSAQPAVGNCMVFAVLDLQRIYLLHAAG